MFCVVYGAGEDQAEDCSRLAACQWRLSIGDRDAAPRGLFSFRQAQEPGQEDVRALCVSDGPGSRLISGVVWCLSEALLLLYGLMHSVALPTYNEDVRRHPDVAANNVDSSAERGSIMPRLEKSETDENGDSRDYDPVQSMPTASLGFEGPTAARAFPSMGHSKADLDSLEDSFKFAVGIAPVHKAHKRKAGNTRTSAEARPGAVLPSAISASVNRAGHLSFDVPEAVLLRDVLYALQAIESRYLYFDDALDRFQITRSVGVPTRKITLPVIRCEVLTLACVLFDNSHALADLYVM